MSFGTGLLYDILSDIMRSIVDHIGFLISDIYSYAVEINNTAQVSAACTYTMMLGAALCTLAVILQLTGTYGMGTTGDPDQDPVEILFRLCKALGIMGANVWIFNQTNAFTTGAARDLTKVLAAAVTSNTINDMIGKVNDFFTLICAGVCVVCMILFFVSAVLRGAEVTLNKVLLPIFAVDMLKANPERWNMFIFQYFISFISYLVQMFCFQMYAILYAHLDFTDFRQYLVMVAWLILCIKAPKTLEKYIYATGTGRAVSQGASRLGQVVMYAGMKL